MKHPKSKYYFCLLFNRPSRLGRDSLGLPKKSLWGLLIGELYRQDVLPVTYATVSLFSFKAIQSFPNFYGFYLKCCVLVHFYCSLV